MKFQTLFCVCSEDAWTRVPPLKGKASSNPKYQNWRFGINQEVLLKRLDNLASDHKEKQELQVMPKVNDFDVILLEDKTVAHGITCKKIKNSC